MVDYSAGKTTKLSHLYCTPIEHVCTVHTTHSTCHNKKLGRQKSVDFISQISEGREGLGEPWLTLSGKMIDRRQSFDLIIPYFFFKYLNRLGVNDGAKADMDRLRRGGMTGA